MSNEEIVKELQNGKDVTLNQERLWLKNKGMIYKIAKKCCRGEYYSDISEDLAQQGFLGLINASVKYKEKGDAKFITYAIPFIRGAMYTYMANAYNIFRIPQYMRKRLRSYEALLNDTYSREMSDREICDLLSISYTELKELEKLHNRLQYYSSDAAIPGGDDEDCLIDTIASNENIEEIVLSAEWEKDLHSTMTKALSSLDDKTKQMIKCVYYLGYGNSKLARIMNCSSAYVGSRIERGLKKMRDAYGNELAEFI